MAPDSDRESRLVSRWLLALGLRLLRALRRHRCACRRQLRGPLRRLQRRPRLDWATPTRRPLALTPASAACVVRRLSCKNHFTTETERHRGKADLQIARGITAILVLLIGLCQSHCARSILRTPFFGRWHTGQRIFNCIGLLSGFEQVSHEAQNQPQHDDNNRQLPPDNHTMLASATLCLRDGFSG